MVTPSLREQLIEEVDSLTPDQQAHLLAVARHLRKSTLPPGTPGETLLANMTHFTFAPGAVDEMMQAIEAGCERIDWDGWG